MKSTSRDGSWISVATRARVLGIDPGTRIAGYAILDCDLRNECVIVDAGVFRLSATAPLIERLKQLHDDLTALIAEHSPTHMALEAIFSHSAHAATAIQMAHGRGVVLLAAAQRAIPVAELPPAEVKKALTGNGRATKEQMQRAVMTQCRLTVMPEPHDVADAIGIALCGARRLRGVA